LNAGCLLTLLFAIKKINPISPRVPASGAWAGSRCDALCACPRGKTDRGPDCPAAGAIFLRQTRRRGAMPSAPTRASRLGQHALEQRQGGCERRYARHATAATAP